MYRPIALTCCLMCLSAAASAAPVVFTIDSALSSLSVQSSVSLFGTPLTTASQSPESLTTSYTGELHFEITASTIQLLAPSRLIAGNSGNWQPGTDYSNYPGDLNDPSGYVNLALPANYGLLTDLTPLGPVLGKNGWSPSAIRGLEIALSDAAPKPLAGGAFDESASLVDFAAGTVFYSSGGSPPITDLANTVQPNPTLDAPGTALLTTSGNQLVVTLPVSFTAIYDVNFLTLANTYHGTIVARAIVPEPASWMACGLGGSMLLAWMWRARRRAAR